MKKRFFVVFVLCLCVIFAISAYAEVVDSGKCGDNLTWTLDDEGTLTISGTGDMYDYNSSGENPAPWMDRINEIVIEEGVTSIGDQAFSGAYIKKLTLPNSLTKIGNYAFHMVSIDELIIPDSVTSIGEGAFSYSSHKVISIGKNLSTIGDTAFRLTWTDEIIVSKENRNLSLDENKVLFDYNKEKLLKTFAKDDKNYSIPNGVKEIGAFAFDACKYETISIPDTVEIIGACAFSETDIKSVVLPDSVKKIGDSAFLSSYQLESIVLPNGITEISDFAFSFCYKLTSIDIPDSVTNLGRGVFYGSQNLTNITVGKNNSSYLVDESGVLFNKEKTKLVHYPSSREADTYSIPDSVTNIEDLAFAYCCLTSVEIPEGVTSIGNYAFEGCYELTAIKIPSSVTSIGDYAIYDTTICGYPGTTAETYAKENDVPFVDISTATPTNAKVLVNGKEISFTAYNIGGNNYFKLRDIALALNGSEKNFGVGWDADKKAVSLTSKTAYVPVGGELVVDSEAVAVKPVVSDSAVYLYGEKQKFLAFNIKGNNYFKLRDIGKAFDFGIGWDNATKTITIDTANSYTE